MTLPDPTRSVRASTMFVGFHRWPGARGTRAYLAKRHRHQFTVTAELGVDHHDRDVEFHDLADYLAAAVHNRWTQHPDHPGSFGGGLELGDLSCEAVAELVAGDVEFRWPGRLLWVEVSEDLQVHARLNYRNTYGPKWPAPPTPPTQETAP